MRSRSTIFLNAVHRPKPTKMTAYLPPNLLAMFAPRDPLPYFPPLDHLPWEKKPWLYTGVAQYLEEFEVWRMCVT